MNAQLVDLIKPLLEEDGFQETSIANVRLMRCSKSLPRMPLMYRPSLTIIAQGQKIGYLGDREIHYHSGQFLVQSLPLPFECETFASPEAPLFGVSIDLDPVLLSELVTDPYDHEWKPTVPYTPMSSVPMSDDMESALVKLVQALHDPKAARLLGNGRVREVIYAALQCPEASALKALAVNQGIFSRIVQAIRQMNLMLDQEIRIESMADEANMSVSSFHHHFKTVTGSSPLQYLKRLRLLKAQMLLSQGAMGVSQIGLEVGYKSVHQFSRDYKRYFGAPPTRDKSREGAVV